MSLLEWSFVTATTDGRIISMDGFTPNVEVYVQDVCKTDGWDVEHANFDSEPPTFWQLILSRPLQPMMPTRGHLDDAVIVGVGTGGSTGGTHGASHETL
jgi:hypothetical protein